MTKDHYVAVTYLKHFGDPQVGGMLHAYNKSDGSYFKCWPKDVCHEWDGDLNPKFFNDPGLLGSFRKIFEPKWNLSIANILEGKVSDEDKFIVAAYMANLMVCNPTWIRIGVTNYNNMVHGMLSVKYRFQEKHGVVDQLLKEGLEWIEQGKLKIDTDSDYIKAQITKNLISYALINFNRDWLVIRNDTNFPFFTSDNPVGVEYSGEIGDPLIRYLPVTPKLCLRVTYDSFERPLSTPEEIKDAIHKKPNGKIKVVKVSPLGARHINTQIIKSAENLVFSSINSDVHKNLILKYSKYQLDSEFIEIPDGEDAYLHGITIKVLPSRVS